MTTTPDPTSGRTSAGPSPDAETGSARGQHEHPWVQPILVAKDGMHQPTIELVARASAAVFLDHPGHPTWEPWLAGPFTKSVRRANYASISKATAWAAERRIPHHLLSAPYPDATTESIALAFAPMRYEDVPKIIAKCQVTGTDLTPRDEAEVSADQAVRLHDHLADLVFLHVDGDLSTGKAAAQAAHALWAWMLDHLARGTGRVERWDEAGTPVMLRLAAKSALPALSQRDSGYAVVDAGLTEVEPGSLTAVAIDGGFDV